MFWINGVAQNTISITDRSVQFGDGCFTTTRVVDGKISWINSHLQRLQQDAERLRLPAINWNILQDEMSQRVQQIKQGVLKVIITRGSGGRGYSSAACEHPTRILVLSEYPLHYHTWRTRGISLALSPIPLARNPWLTGIKHLNRLEQILVRMHLEQTDADEALVLDTAGMLVECCAANLFWRKKMDVFTPDLSQSGVDGIMRRRITEYLATLSYRLHYVTEPISTLANADEIIVCNALMP